jgi:hypothetical protein
MYIKASWSDYFTGTPNIIQKNEYGERQTLSGTNVYVLYCLFKSITSTSEGGALYGSSVTYLFVESTSFFSCKTSGNVGGAISFYNSGSGQCVLHEVCGYDCYSTCTSTSNHQFANIYVSDAASSINYVNYSSVTRCVSENSYSYNMFGLSRGKICCPSINISMNKCRSYSVISCWPSIDSNYVTCSLTYSTFSDNIAAATNCFWLNRQGAKFEIIYCNIIRNSESSGTNGIIYTDGSLMIENSCILGNKGTYIFRQASSYTITLLNCTVDSTSITGSVVTQNTVTKSFILALNHMSTQNCHSEYDSVGTLTPITPPYSSKKLIICFTYGKLFFQPQLTDFISFHSIFIFNFIHLDTSCGH